MLNQQDRCLFGSSTIICNYFQLLPTIGSTMRCIDQAYISLFVRFWHVKGDLLAETLSPPIRLRASLSSYICDNFLVLPFPKVQHLLPPDPNRRSTNPISGSQVQFLQPAPSSNHWTLKTGIDGLRRNNCPVVRWGHPIPSTWILSTLCKYSQLYIILHMVIALNAHAILPSLLTKKDHMLHTGERYALPIASSQCTMLRLL